MTVLDRLIRDARPEAVITPAEWGPDLARSPVLVHGTGYDDALAAVEFAQLMDFGSVIYIRRFPDDLAVPFEAAMALCLFREWDNHGEEGSRVWVKAVGDLGYGSHGPVLVGAVGRTCPAPVLELGAGHGSTGLLHELCAAQNRRLMTLESNDDWAQQFIDLRSDLHAIELVESISDAPELTSLRWGVVFIDHAPGETRALAIDRVRGFADYVVVHDTEELGYGMELAISSYKYRHDFRRHRPWTTVVSMTREIWR